MTVPSALPRISRYPLVLRIIHWSVAALVAMQFGLMLVLHQLQSLEFGQVVLALHRQCGLLTLAFIVLRFALAPFVRRPMLKGMVPPWQRRTAAIVHLGLLVLLIAQPLLGVLVTWSRGDNIVFLGVLEIPALMRLTVEQGVELEAGHRWLAYGLLTLITLHLCGVIFNHLVCKSPVAERMFRGTKPDRLVNRIPVLAQLGLCCGAILSLTLAAGLHAAHQYALGSEIRARFDETEVTALDEMRAVQLTIETLHIDSDRARTTLDAAAILHSLKPRISDPDARIVAGRAARALERIAAGKDPSGAINTARKELQSAVDSQAMKLFQRRLEINQIAAKSHDMIILAIVPTVMLSAVLAFLLSRSVLLALATARRMVRHVETGEADEAIIVRGHGEFAALMRDIVRMRGAVETRERESHRREAEIAERAAADRLRAATEQAEILRAKVAADSASQAKSDFLANMSHELRTPLNAILGYAQLLKRDPNLSERQSNAAGTIHQSGSHLLTLINDILDLSKIEAGKCELHPAAFDLRNFLGGIADIIRVRTEEKGLDFVCEVPADLPPFVLGDEKRLRQVLINLLGNAAKFSDRGQIGLHVAIVSRTPTTARIGFEVRDTGVGIAENQLLKIFQPFEQSGDMIRRAGGTGLGLSISRQLVELMQSRLRVESSLGKGSRFWFELDLPIEEVQASPVPAPALASGYRGRRRSVLIVDDIAENRAVLADMLDELGFDTRQACNGREGLESAKATPPDLILMDVRMPVMDGHEAMRLIRKIEALMSVPIIAVSAGVTREDQANSLAVGANAFLTKPVQRDELFRIVAQHLQLDWTDGTPNAPAETVSDLLPIVAPPPAEIATLHSLVRAGNMRAIKREADRIGALDDRYHGFVEKLHALAQAYQSQTLLELVEQFLRAENTETS